MYTLYIANKNYSSWSLRPWVLMKALGIPFEERLTVFREGSNWEPFREFSPAGLVPCLRDGPTVVWDSLGIAEYLAERHPGVWPADGGARAWARCAAAEMHSGFAALRGTCTMNCGLRIRLREVTPALQRNLDRIGELWNEGLDRFGGPWLTGASFTAVDAFYAPVAFRVQTYDLRLGGAANAYASRLLALPAMQEWYAAALKETWRENAHEAEARDVGTVLQDLRAKA
ncbi:MAG: glutathione S-transferase family protein [Gammaproteobacteria bacterium]|nr:glutathione S-transferase family protein [Gammaproteobacteria bacterium]